MWYFFLEDCDQWAAVGDIRRFCFFNPDTSVDFNTVQKTNMDQFQKFFIKTVASLISIRFKMQIHVPGSSVDNCVEDSFLLVSQVI